jgi:hypothetical protein
VSDYDEKLAVFACMAEKGGSFARALAEAWVRADVNNKRRIEEAFPDYVRDYGRLVKKEEPK